MKKTMSWKYDPEKGSLICYHADSNDTQKFDLSSIFVNIIDIGEIQSTIICYGVKQKLADSVARPKDQKLTSAERQAIMKDTFERIVSGQWNADKEGIERVSKKKIAEKLEGRKLSKDQKELLTELGLI